jgi:hypothetical protein
MFSDAEELLLFLFDDVQKIYRAILFMQMLSERTMPASVAIARRLFLSATKTGQGYYPITLHAKSD